MFSKEKVHLPYKVLHVKMYFFYIMFEYKFNKKINEISWVFIVMHSCVALALGYIGIGINISGNIRFPQILVQL